MTMDNVPVMRAASRQHTAQALLTQQQSEPKPQEKKVAWAQS